MTVSGWFLIRTRSNRFLPASWAALSLFQLYFFVAGCCFCCCERWRAVVSPLHSFVPPLFHLFIFTSRLDTVYCVSFQFFILFSLLKLSLREKNEWPLGEQCRTETRDTNNKSMTAQNRIEAKSNFVLFYCLKTTVGWVTCKGIFNRHLLAVSVVQLISAPPSLQEFFFLFCNGIARRRYSR